VNIQGERVVGRIARRNAPPLASVVRATGSQFQIRNKIDKPLRRGRIRIDKTAPFITVRRRRA